jgi:Txe/YoeB family toxin of Txe-Axe toxin-antitoxin module
MTKKKAAEKIKDIPSLVKDATKLLKLIKNNPYAIPPFYEKLQGDL